jgi:hypothetical protein
VWVLPQRHVLAEPVRVVHASEDLVVSARWADDRANPPKVKVHRINGVLQNVAFIMQEVETVSPEVMKAMIPLLQEATCPEPTPQPTSGSDSTTSSVTTEPIDYSALLNLL